MSLKRAKYCLVPKGWTAAQLRGKICDSRHHHITKRNADAMVRNGEAVWLDRQILRRTQRGTVPNSPLRSLTAKVGEVLAAAFRRRESWAVAMVRAIRKQQERDTYYESRPDLHGGIRAA